MEGEGDELAMDGGDEVVEDTPEWFGRQGSDTPSGGTVEESFLE